jgi:hypothetical protein
VRACLGCVASRLALGVLTFSTGLSAFSQPGGALDAYQIECIKAASAQAGGVGQWAVVRRATAPFSAVEDLLTVFTQEFAAQNLDDRLLDCEGFESKAVVIVYQDPRGLGEVPMAVGLTVPGPVEPTAPLLLERVFEPVAVKYTHVGPYQELDRVYEEITSSLPEGSSPKFPAWMCLVNDPRRVDPSLIQTDLIVPVRQPPTLSDDEKTRIFDAVQAADRVTYLLVAQTFEGSISNIAVFLDQYMGRFEGAGLGEALASQDTAPLALLHSNPDTGGNIQIDIGLPVVEGIDVGAPFRLQEFVVDRAVLYTHMGAYEELSAVYAEIRRVAGLGPAPAEPQWPAGMRLLTDPDTVATPEEIKTQLIIPLSTP